MKLWVTLKNAQYMLRLVLPLYQLATNLSERVSITLYILRFFLARLFKGRFQQEDAAIRLKGTTYVLGLRSVEFGPLAEVYLSRTYEQHHDFIPDAGWTVFDIGANIGAFAIQQARRGAHVYAFEPNPACYRRLSMAVLKNKLTEVRTFNYAVGSVAGLGIMHIPGMWTKWTNMGSVVPIDGSASIDVSVVTITSLDHIIPSLGLASVDLLKVDVEGAEVDVLKGAEHTLRLVKRIAVEYHSQELLEQVIVLLRNHGFSLELHVSENPPPGYSAIGLLYYMKQSSDTNC